jgi:hypothetical protein
MNPMDKYNQLMEGIRNPGSLDKGLSFGPHGGMFGSVAPSQNINPGRDNPNGITGAHQSNGAGFSGNTAHFNTVGLPQMNAQPIYDPTRGVYQQVTYDPNSVGNAEMAAQQAQYAEEAAAWYQHDNGHEVTANGGVLPGSDPSDREAVMPDAQGQYVVPTPETTTPETTTPETPEVPVAERPDFTSNYDPRGQATPFLDSYIRSKEAAKAEGPVTGMMKKYME